MVIFAFLAHWMLVRVSDDERNRIAWFGFVVFIVTVMIALNVLISTYGSYPTLDEIVPALVVGGIFCMVIYEGVIIILCACTMIDDGQVDS